jgi:hypothetical protein
VWEQQHERDMPINWLAVCKHGSEACVRPEHIVCQKLGSTRLGVAQTPARRAAQAQARRAKYGKLTAQDVQEIRESQEPRRALAKRFGVSESCISQIHQHAIWRDYSGPFAALFTGLLASNESNARRTA